MKNGFTADAWMTGYRSSLDPVPGYLDAFGNMVYEGDYVILAPSQSGRLEVGRIVSIDPEDGVVKWRSTTMAWKTRSLILGPVRVIRHTATARYTGGIPAEIARVLDSMGDLDRG